MRYAILLAVLCVGCEGSAYDLRWKSAESPECAHVQLDRLYKTKGDVLVRPHIWTAHNQVLARVQGMPDYAVVACRELQP